MQPFVATLRREIALRGATASPDPIESIFFGGGTPSLLSAEQISLLLADLHSRWNVLPTAEVSMECNPGTVTEDSLAGYRAAGVNRLSFGVQSFHAHELAFLQRIHSADDARAAMALARNAGFDNVNMDVMFALPGQTCTSFAETLDSLLALSPDHVSAYSLIFEHGTPLYAQLKKGLVQQQSEEVDAEMYALAIERLTGEGYVQYEVSNFAKPGKKCRHNLAYWHAKPHWSFGPSAHGMAYGVRTFNVRSLTAWTNAVESGSLPHATVERLSLAQQCEEYLFLHLRADGIPIQDVRAQFEVDILSLLRPHLDYWIEGGLVSLENNVLALTGEGYRVCDEITVHVLDKLDYSMRMASAIRNDAALRAG